jgi:GTP cyclohydrolase II
VPIVWGAEDPMRRGPLIGSVTNKGQRNVIGTHAGSYSVYRAVAVAAGALDPLRRPDLTNTSPTNRIGPFPQWFDPKKIVALDPFGAIVSEAFSSYFEKGYDIRPTIAVTRAQIKMAELDDAIAAGRLKVDGKILRAGGAVYVTKAALEPVWYLPGVAARFGCSEADLRRTLFEHTAGMFPELVTRNDLEVFLPPIGGATIYMFGDTDSIPDPSRPLAVRVHDECNGSDVFGSDICTCRPYLTHGIEECVRTAQEGGTGVIVYSRKEGRALGEVTKFLVYNARKRQVGGDRAEHYFARTECVAGVQDMRFQELMPDYLHWLGITKIDRFVSMSNMKHDAVTRAGIEIIERVPIPDELIPDDARVEMDAKMAAGYYTEGEVPDGNELAKAKGRTLDA